jgi:2-dehydro-3-deoxygluconokinase
VDKDISPSETKVMPQAQALDVVTIGEAMVLFIAGQGGALAQVQSFKRASAGAELNVAVGLARLGLRVGYISRVGRDSFGEHLLAFMDAEGIDRRQVAIDPAHPTGFMLKSLASDGADPQIEYFRAGSAASHMCQSDNPLGYCAGSRHLHLTGISLALSSSTRALAFEMAAQARTQGRSLSFDPNLRPRLWPSQQAMVDCLNQMATQADLVLPGLAEGQVLSGRPSAEGIADFFLERGAKQVIVKLGAQGAYFAGQASTGSAPGLPVAQVVDTVGAGDGFAVGAISALLEGLTLEQMAVRGNAIGARVVQFPGDSDGLPDRAQLAQAMRATASP